VVLYGVIRCSSGGSRVEPAHVPVSRLCELICGPISSSVDELRLHLSGVDIVYLEREVFRLVDEERHTGVGELLVGNGRGVLGVGADRQVVERMHMHPVAALSDVALVVSIDDTRLCEHEVLLELGEDASRPDLRQHLSNSHMWL
jgi:hypothetical protein